VFFAVALLLCRTGLRYLYHPRSSQYQAPTVLRYHYLRGPGTTVFLHRPMVVPLLTCHNFSIGIRPTTYVSQVPTTTTGIPLPYPFLRGTYAARVSTQSYDNPVYTICYVESTATSTAPGSTTDPRYPTVGSYSRPTVLRCPYHARPTAGLRHPTAFLIHNQIAVPGTSLSTAVSTKVYGNQGFPTQPYDILRTRPTILSCRPYTTFYGKSTASYGIFNRRSNLPYFSTDHQQTDLPTAFQFQF